MTTNRKKYVMIFFLTLTTLCYSLPYLSSSFYTQFLEAFSLSNTQAGFLMSMFSLTATPGYLFGGIIADKFSPKKVIMLSQLLTAALGYAMCLIQGYSILLVCYLGFGISTTFLHWSAYLKLVRAQANENEEGKIFGFFETCAAVVGAVTSYGILGLLGHISSFRVVTAIYASILVVVTIIIGLTLEDPKNEQASNEFNVRMVGKALAHPVTWINGFIVMGLFILATGTSYLNPYLCSVFGTSVEFGTALAIANRTVIRIFVVGIGNSGSIASYGARYFSNLGKFALSVSDPFYPITLTDCTSAAALVFSVSGETPEVLKLAHDLRERGCTLLAVTGNESCTLAQVCDLTLPYYTATRRSGVENYDMTSQIPAVYLLESLARRVHNRLNE